MPGTTHRVVRDPIGSVRMVVDAASGAIAQRLDYDPLAASCVRPRLAFSRSASRVYDADTGLMQLGVRTYDPVTGRWLERDPSMFGGGDSNLYAYAAGDPVNYVDPDGRMPVLLVAIAVEAFEGAPMETATVVLEQALEKGCIDLSASRAFRTSSVAFADRVHLRSAILRIDFRIYAATNRGADRAR